MGGVSRYQVLLHQITLFPLDSPCDDPESKSSCLGIRLSPRCPLSSFCLE